jgi:hypothetical protein
VTGPLAQRRQRPRRRITPNTNTSTTTTISTHNHVDMAASLIGAGQVKLTLLPPTRASNSVAALCPGLLSYRHWRLGHFVATVSQEHHRLATWRPRQPQTGPIASTKDRSWVTWWGCWRPASP